MGGSALFRIGRNCQTEATANTNAIRARSGRIGNFRFGGFGIRNFVSKDEALGDTTTSLVRDIEPFELITPFRSFSVFISRSSETWLEKKVFKLSRSTSVVHRSDCQASQAADQIGNPSRSSKFRVVRSR